MTICWQWLTPPWLLSSLGGCRKSEAGIRGTVPGRDLRNTSVTSSRAAAVTTVSSVTATSVLHVIVSAVTCHVSLCCCLVTTAASIFSCSHTSETEGSDGHRDDVNRATDQSRLRLVYQYQHHLYHHHCTLHQATTTTLLSRGKPAQSSVQAATRE